jgi:hypothetical protein
MKKPKSNKTEQGNQDSNGNFIYQNKDFPPGS